MLGRALERSGPSHASGAVILAATNWTAASPSGRGAPTTPRWLAVLAGQQAETQAEQFAVGSDHIMFASDYPYEMATSAARWIETTPISENDRRKIRYGTAAALFGLPR